jgi:hypothetical protein
MLKGRKRQPGRASHLIHLHISRRRLWGWGWEAHRTLRGYHGPGWSCINILILRHSPTMASHLICLHISRCRLWGWGWEAYRTLRGYRGPRWSCINFLILRHSPTTVRVLCDIDASRTTGGTNGGSSLLCGGSDGVLAVEMVWP